jgi:hypothetical protein
MHDTGFGIIKTNTQSIRSKLLRTGVSISAEPSTTLRSIVTFLRTSTEMTPYYLQSSQNRFPPHTSKFTIHFYLIIGPYKSICQPVTVAALSKAWVCGRSPAEIVGSNPTGGMECRSVVSIVYCQVEVSATG